MKNNESWQAIFNKYDLNNHDFEKTPFKITAEQIKEATKHLKSTSQKEVRILCKQDSRTDRPQIFYDKNLFLLPIINGQYVILQGDGYVDIPKIDSVTEIYESKLDFDLKSSKIGNSEMQHLDFAYASSLIRTFIQDDSLVLTIRGRKYCPKFEFKFKEHNLIAESVQTEVDAGFEGKEQIVLIEAKNSTTQNTIIRQLYYPYRQWQINTGKRVRTLFFEKQKDEYLIWEFAFRNDYDYSSIYLKEAKRYKIANSKLIN